MPSRLLSVPNRLRNILFLLVLIALVGVAAPFIIRRTAASRRSDQTPSLLPSSQKNIARNYGELALSFERNDGQTSSEARFISRGPGYDLFLTATGAVLNLRKTGSPAVRLQKDAVTVSQSFLYLKMIGASTRASIKGDDELMGKVNYFVGNDPSRWLANIPTYGKVRYTGIFPGVDLVYYGNRTQLEYDFVLAPHANLASIQFEIEGAEKIKIGNDGDLQLATKQGEVRLRKPQIYQLSEAGEREV
ncbi:MAG: hypothetical protein QOK48_2016, partial [Blastocatellia bacterium]|nr:hypothetical protein [Blastocatellia bacterium]